MFSQAQTFGEIHLEGQGHSLTINQIIQISVSEVKTRPFIGSSPYVGLRRFDEVNKDFFFGRDRLVGQLLNLVKQHNLVLVAGASGSGKSSLVRAGLLPQLRTRLPQGRFQSLVMTPDRDPFQSLRGVLQVAGVAQKHLDALHAESADALVRTLLSRRPREHLWLLFVDQFEEIFTLCQRPSLREAFLDGLTQLAQGAQSEIKIVLSMRADFFDRFGPHPEFGKVAESGLCLVMDMQASELRAAIEQPAARHGVVFEEGLVEQIIGDVKSRPGTLPLLQYALDLLWQTDDPSDDRTLNSSSYQRIGCIEGALQRRADALYDFEDAAEGIRRPEAQQEAIRRIFLRLVDLTSKGTEGRAVSRRTPLTGFAAEEEPLLRELIDANLLVSSALTDAQGRPLHRPTIEIAHEALLSAWTKLKEWIEQARVVLYVRNRLSADAHHYAEVKVQAPSRAHDELWSGTRLHDALEMRARGEFAAVLGRELTKEEETFLVDSDNKKRAEEAAKADADQKLRTAYEQVRQQLLNTYVEQGRQLLFEQNRPGEALLWLHRALARGSTHPGLLDLLKSARQSIGVGHTVLAGHLDSIQSASSSPDGRHIVTASADHTARVWESETGQLIAELKGHKERVNSATYSPDGRRIVTASSDETARIWEAETGSMVAELQGHNSSVNYAAFSPDGRRIFTASSGMVRIWEVATGCQLAEFEARIDSLAYSHDSRHIVTGNEFDTARVWDAETGTLVFELRDHNQIACAAYSPDDRHIVTASWHKTARIWNAETGELITELKGHEGFLYHAMYSPDGRHVVTASSDNTARVWEVETGSQIVELKGHTSSVSSATYSPDGRHILTASKDKTARLWEAETGRLLSELKGHERQVLSATYAANGSRILTLSADHTARLWNAKPSRLLVELKGHPGKVNRARYSPDGRQIITASTDPIARIWDAETGHLTAELKGPGDGLISVLYSPNGRRIYTSYFPIKSALIWEADTGLLVAKLWCDEGFMYSPVYSPDSRYIVTASGRNTGWVWEVETGRLITQLNGSGVSVIGATFSPDGSRLATRGWDNTVRLWDVDTWSLITELQGHGGRVHRASYSPDGSRLVTASRDTALQWEAQTGHLLTELKHRGSVSIATYSPDGSHILTSEGQTGRIWEATTGRVIQELKGHEGDVDYGAYGRDGHRIVTQSGGTARLWEAETGRMVAKLEDPGTRINDAMLSPDGRRFVAANDDRTARIWDVSEESFDVTLIDHFIRCHVPLRFEQEDSDVLIPGVPDSTEQ